MPVSKHRRRGKLRTKRPGLSQDTSRPKIKTIDEIRQAVADPALDFRAKIVLAGAWWFDNLLLKLGDHKKNTANSETDAPMSGSLLCMAMDGQRGKNDDISPLIADMLRPWCPTPTFADAWEQANNMPPGTVAALAANDDPEQTVPALDT